MSRNRLCPSDASLAVWLLLAALVLVDVIGGIAHGFRLSHWGRLALVSSGLVGLMLIYRLSGRSHRVAALTEAILQWIAFSIAGAVLTYLAAAQGYPLYDREFTAADAALGFDWWGWFDIVRHQPVLKWPLGLIYNSLMPQILLSACWFAWRDRDGRNAELLILVILTLVLTTAIFGRLPALGPGADLPNFVVQYSRELVALRDGATVFDVMQLKGVVSFPSFHATLAVLFAYAHRGTRVFLPIAVLNTAMLASIPSEGGHYLVDVFGGLAIAALAIAGAAAYRAWRRTAAAALQADRGYSARSKKPAVTVTQA